MTVERDPVPQRSEFAVVRPIPTRWSDNDHYRHVNNVVYLAPFEES